MPDNLNSPFFAEWKILLEALKGKIPELQGVDPLKLLHLLRRHKLTPWFYTQMIKPHFSKDHPICLALKDYFREHQQKALLQLAERIILTKKLSDQGIDALHIKGAVLSILLYQDPTVRLSGDIDILIAPENFLKADQVLLQLGYLRETPTNDMIENHLSLFQKYMKDAIYWHPEKKILLELHWRLTTSPYWMNPGFQMLWNERSQISYSGFEFNTLSPSQHFLYLCLHGTRHAYTQLQWLQDISQWIKQGMIFDTQNQVTAQQFHLGPALETTHALLKLFSMPHDASVRPSKASQHHAQQIYQHLLRYPEQKIEQGEQLSILQRLRLVWHLHPKKTLLPHLHFVIQTYAFERTAHKDWLLKNPLLTYGLCAWYLITRKKGIS